MTATLRDQIERALTNLTAAVAEQFGGDPTDVHWNFGQSDDYTTGFNTGYDDAEAGSASGTSAKPPPEDPWAAAYHRGYQAGRATWQEHQEEEPTS